MLVSVTERTREIGIRKAIGATPRGPSCSSSCWSRSLLAGLGGLIGVVVGVGISIAGGQILPQLVPDFPAPVVVDRLDRPVARRSAWLIGLIAGGYPANRAARLRPIEALRYQ